ncbi:MAG: DUF4912 domain-containing protein, partial [Halanaerobiales bacterium]
SEESGVDVEKMKKNTGDQKEEHLKVAETQENVSSNLSKREQQHFHEKDDYPLYKKYNINYIRLLLQEPETLFAYWEITDNKFFHNRPLLKLYCKEENTKYNIEISHDTRNWYIDCSPNKEYHAVIGYIKNDTFHPVVSSNIIKTPPKQPSSIIDEQWMLIEKLSGYSYRIEMDTLSMIKNIEERKIEKELEADSYSLIKK